jgi:ATP-dependent Lon protease
LKAESKRYPTRITPASIQRFLGPPQYFNLEAERQDEIGVATAVAWTETGGEIMPVEVLLFDGKGGMQITGQIGSVMQESAQAALSYLKSRTHSLKLSADIFERVDIHIHIPEGAIPKDGPSAGITICTALASAFTGREVRHDISMTGEITLRGRVLPVGGIREKILAAHRAGIKNVIIPKYNLKDLVEIPKRARSEIKIIPVEHIDEVLEIALLKSPDKPKKPRAQRKKTAKIDQVEPDQAASVPEALDLPGENTSPELAIGTAGA